MTGPLTAVRRLTSTATGLVTTTVRTGAAAASTAVHGALHLVRRDGGSGAEDRSEQRAPEPVRAPTPPDPAVKVAQEQARTAAAKPVPGTKAAAKKAATKAPATSAPAQETPAKKAAAKKAPATKALTPKAPTPQAPATKAAPKPAPPKKKASDVPLKSDPTPASAAPQEPEGPDVRPGDGGATGLAEAEPLLDPGVAAQVRAESEQLRSAAE